MRKQRERERPSCDVWERTHITKRKTNRPNKKETTCEKYWRRKKRRLSTSEARGSLSSPSNQLIFPCLCYWSLLYKPLPPTSSRRTHPNSKYSIYLFLSFACFRFISIGNWEVSCSFWARRLCYCHQFYSYFRLSELKIQATAITVSTDRAICFCWPVASLSCHVTRQAESLFWLLNVF
jgi:hypothetical protein